MRPCSRAHSRPLRIALLSLAIGAGAALGPSVASVQIARADDDPVTVGAMLVARTDVEIQKVVIARSTKVEVTKTASDSVDVALPDGYVLHKIPKNRILYFFDVTR